MKKNIHLLFSSALLIVLHSCTLKEQLDPVPETGKGYNIEFVARPTSYSQFNVSTKATENEINDLENKIYTAFFMLFDDDGKRVIFKDLTANITSGSSAVENGNNLTYLLPEQSIVSDKALTNATVCFIANVPTDYAKSLTTVNDLKGAKPLNLTYESITARCIGIPILTDASKNLDGVYSLPMAGIVTSNLSKISGSTEPVQIPLERLFAKIIINMTVNMTNSTQRPSNFTLSNYVVKNIPTKVAIMAPDNDPPSTILAASNVASDYLTNDNVLTNFNLNSGSDDSNTVENGDSKSFFFYVPEHMVPRDIENNWGEETRQWYKPTLITPDSGKNPVYVSIHGGIVDENGNDAVAQYDIYLGENEYDDFNVKRNKLYNNYIRISGTGNVDHRVDMSHGDITVSFKRASHLDSHFEVRPLRVTWSGEDENDNPTPATGKITIEVLNASDGTDIPNWVRLERPTDPSNTTLYCGSEAEKTLGKRRYFTTDLVSTTLAGSGKKVEYQISDDANGNIPTWVYVDEYVSLTNNVFTDAARQAKIRVQYTPENASSPSHTVDYVITQRSVYPILATNQDITNIIGQATGKYTYGIEFFEEYLYNYDNPNIQDSDGFTYDETQNGMGWGLDGITLSRNNKALFVSKAEATLGPGTDTRATQGWEDVKPYLSGFLDEIMSSKIETLPAYYDYYSSKDVSTGILSNIETRDFAGYNINVEIIHTLLQDYSSDSRVLLNRFSLDNNNPLSVIAYCYNKNKRDANGNIVTLSGSNNETINLSNMHWYAPSIEEIEDIIISAHDLEDEFSVFGTYYYWSCQPAYMKNDVDIKYTANVIWEERNFKIGWPPYTVVANRPVIFNISGSGPYYQDDSNRARATMYDESGLPVSSSVDGTSFILATNGFNDFGKIVAYRPEDFYLTLTSKMSTQTPTWSPANPVPTPAGETLTYHEGNDPRSQLNRVRCVYNPDPPTKATRTANDNGGYDYTYTD